MSSLWRKSTRSITPALSCALITLGPGANLPSSLSEAPMDKPAVIRSHSAGSPAAELAARPTDHVLKALRLCASRLEPDERQLIAKTIVRTAHRFGYDPLFVQALVEVESTCRPTVRSHAGAIGLIQLQPATARAVAQRAGMRWQGPHELLEPVVNLELGVRYLAELEERFDDPYVAVAAYNLGPTRVARMAPTRARQARYVRKVMARYEGLLERHAAAPS